jgi:hypothetical protein
MRDRSSDRRQGFTLTELVILGGIVAIGLGLLVYFFYRASQYNVIIHGAWKVAPKTIPPAPLTGTFTYHVTRQQDAASVITNAVGRKIKFDLTVTSKDGTIFSCNNVALPSPPVKTCTADTDANGNIDVVVSLEKTGVANLVATDVDSGQTDPPQRFSAP